jgi:2-polyprenyl-3-methyl-5-hydroxy-6-metoxy-1,4-benzoquinol methylase
MDRAQLISDAYIKENRELHAKPRGFGQSGRKHAAEVIGVASLLEIQSILDYGAGGGTLRTAMVKQGWTGEIREYDPAVPGMDAMPEPAELVVCTDVLEHVEPECLDAVLSHLYQLTQRTAFLCISTVPSSKGLSDGRNAHLSVWPSAWWQRRIERQGWRIRSKFIKYSEKDITHPAVEVSFWLER